eukprot:1780177-Pleurochrysis_carterae.AAC.1
MPARTCAASCCTCTHGTSAEPATDGAEGKLQADADHTSGTGSAFTMRGTDSADLAGHKLGHSVSSSFRQTDDDTTDTKSCGHAEKEASSPEASSPEASSPEAS